MDVWLDARVATAIEEMLGEQAEEEFALRPVDESPDGEYYRGIATAMQIEADLGRLVCARANRLPLDRRRVFYAFAIERRTVEECSALGWGNHDRLLELFSQAVVAITGSLDRKANHDPNGSDPA
ncbi:MAG: hypothetical protein K8S98_05535 [Planctomycetes bacterium]|nr:hypothetical protein [Planctomycetota bacterium]